MFPTDLQAFVPSVWLAYLGECVYTIWSIMSTKGKSRSDCKTSDAFPAYLKYFFLFSTFNEIHKKKMKQTKSKWRGLYSDRWLFAAASLNVGVCNTGPGNRQPSQEQFGRDR